MTLKEFILRKSIVIIIIVAIFLMISSVMNFIQDRWNSNIKSDLSQLEKEKADLNRTLKQSRDMFLSAQDSINVYQERYDSLKKEYELISAQMALDEIEYKKRIDSLKNVPANEVYDHLNVIYPDRGMPLNYPFAEPQIRGMLETKVNLDFHVSILSDKEKQIDNLFVQLLSSENVIKNKNIQIGSLETSLTTSRTYNNNLEESNKELSRAYKSERLMKNIMIGTAGVEFLTILYLIFSN